jgi:23S rRNA (guanosine2251-2'-O)-methyltransferase
MSEIVEGKNSVLELLKSGKSVNRVLLMAGAKSDTTLSEIFKLAKAKGVVIELADRRLLERKSTTGKHQGVIAYTSPHEYCEVEDILEEAKKKNEKPLIVLLDGIEDPQNLGAIVRTAECSGAHGVVIPKRRAAPLTAAVSSASVGAIEYVKVARVPNITEAIEKLKDRGVWVVGIEAGQDKKYDEVDFTLPTAIVIGSEGEGLSHLVKERCEVLASIPLKGKISSLNASVAAAVVLYEAVRQRSKQI